MSVASAVAVDEFSLYEKNTVVLLVIAIHRDTLKSQRLPLSRSECFYLYLGEVHIHVQVGLVAPLEGLADPAADVGEKLSLGHATRHAFPIPA